MMQRRKSCVKLWEGGREENAQETTPMLPPSPRRIALHSSRNTFPTSQGSANPAMTSMSDYLLDLVGNTHAKAQRCALDFAACVVTCVLC
jgi:hypothetical protein